MVIFNSYVKLPEGNSKDDLGEPPVFGNFMKPHETSTYPEMQFFFGSGIMNYLIV